MKKKLSHYENSAEHDVQQMMQFDMEKSLQSLKATSSEKLVPCLSAISS